MMSGPAPSVSNSGGPVRFGDRAVVRLQALMGTPLTPPVVLLLSMSFGTGDITLYRDRYCSTDVQNPSYVQSPHFGTTP